MSTDAILTAVLFAQKRDDVVAAYREGLIESTDDPDIVDWPTVNQAILGRWTLSGLSYIKRKAWSQR